ncbi:hypothetical protein [Pseudomonas aegrilactucae]|uniref:Uncharacterized protein n=1 Tax=Pseudomonas aegrilactucae TaxID=2854028 RepID=A0A9Q2XH63_9PSED|nr:hypothetical protein [Pseudomonas aegrilactucae]MBV6286240.1 hypothetical protein [Pseudomonas aegrilactucae]
MLALGFQSPSDYTAAPVIYISYQSCISFSKLFIGLKPYRPTCRYEEQMMTISADAVQTNTFSATMSADNAPVCFSYFTLEESLEAYQTGAGKVLVLPNGRFGIAQHYTSTLFANTTEDMKVPFYFKRQANGTYKIMSSAKAAYYKKSLGLSRAITATDGAGVEFTVKFIDDITSKNPRIKLYIGSDLIKIFSKKTYASEWHGHIGVDYTPFGIGASRVYGSEAVFRLHDLHLNAPEPPSLF